MTPTLYTQRLAAAVVLLCCGFAVQGCTGGMPQMSKSQTPPPEKVVIPKPPPEVPIQTVTRSPKKAAPVTRSITATPKREDISLSVSYMERIMVPVGSDLTLSATGAGSDPASVKSTKVQSGPPYSISMPVDTGEAAYPMTVQATLTSTLGHVLSGSVTLNEKPTGPVEIIMHIKPK